MVQCIHWAKVYWLACQSQHENFQVTIFIHSNFFRKTFGQKIKINEEGNSPEKPEIRCHHIKEPGWQLPVSPTPPWWYDQALFPWAWLGTSSTDQSASNSGASTTNFCNWCFFHSCMLSDLAFQWKRGWSWICFAARLSDFQLICKWNLDSIYFKNIIYIEKQ